MTALPYIRPAWSPEPDYCSSCNVRRVPGDDWQCVNCGWDERDNPERCPGCGSEDIEDAGGLWDCLTCLMRFEVAS